MKLADIYKKQQKEKIVNQDTSSSGHNVNLIVRMPEVAGLIKHLEVLYSSMIVQNMQRPSNESMWEKVSWFNPGQGAVKQSQSVN